VLLKAPAGEGGVEEQYDTRQSRVLEVRKVKGREGKYGN